MIFYPPRLFFRRPPSAARFGLFRAVLLMGWGVVGFSLPARAVDIFVPPKTDAFLLAVEPIRVEPSQRGDEELKAASVEITQTLNRLCRMSGYFSVLDPAAHLEKPETSGITAEQIDFSLWRILATDFLVKGRLHMDKGTLTAEFRLFDVSAGAFKIGREYTGRPANARAMARKFANEILKAISGVPGIFDTRILFERQVPVPGKKPGRKALYIQDMDGLGPAELLIEREKYHNFAPAWSPDGKRISYLSYADPQAVFIREVYSGNETKLRLKGEQQAMGAVWSPDGKSMAVTVSMHGYSDIVLYNAQSLEPGATVAPTWSNEFDPSFTPDGHRLVFVSDRSGTPQIYISDLDGGRLNRLTFDGRYNASPAVSPDGRRIAWVHEEKEQSDTRWDRIMSIYLMDVDGKNPRRVTIDTGHNEAPAWSPDGRYLIFQSDRTGKYELYLMAADIPMMAVHLSEIPMEGSQTAPSWEPRVSK